MPQAHRRGDIGSGHGCHFPPTPATGGSPDVFVNGRPLMRVGDAYEPHACVAGHAGSHRRKLAKGSPTVFVNGRPAGRIGDAIDCGGEAQTGSGNVFIGDGKTGDGKGMSSDPRAVCQKALARRSTPFMKG